MTLKARIRHGTRASAANVRRDERAHGLGGEARKEGGAKGGAPAPCRRDKKRAATRGAGAPGVCRVCERLGNRVASRAGACGGGGGAPSCGGRGARRRSASMKSCVPMFSIRRSSQTELTNKSCVPMSHKLSSQVYINRCGVDQVVRARRPGDCCCSARIRILSCSCAASIKSCVRRRLGGCNGYGACAVGAGLCGGGAQVLLE